MTDDDLDALREQRRSKLERQMQGAKGPSSPTAVTSADELTDLTERYPVVIVDFHAEWCGPCQEQTPILESIASNTAAVVATVDVDEHVDIAQSHGVRGVPTMVIYADGEPVERLMGVKSETTLESFIDRYIA